MICVAICGTSSFLSEDPAVIEQLARTHQRHGVDGWKYRIEMNSMELLNLLGSPRKGNRFRSKPPDATRVDRSDVNMPADLVARDQIRANPELLTHE